MKLGDEQFALAPQWEEKGLLALRRHRASSPGCPTCSPATPPTSSSRSIDEIGVRDGANLVVEGYDFCPTFSIWTTIEECLEPAGHLGEGQAAGSRREPFSEPETFNFPAGIGPVECVNVEHEEVLLIPRWVDAKRVTFKYGLGDEFIGVLKTIHMLGLDSTKLDLGGRRRRSPRVTSWPPAFPTRPRSVT